MVDGSDGGPMSSDDAMGVLAQGEESGSDAARDDELIVDTDPAQQRGPSGQVVSEHGALQPRRVGVESSGWDVLEPGPHP